MYKTREFLLEVLKKDPSLNATKIAHLTGIPQSVISRIIAGRLSGQKFSTVQRLSQAFGISPADLLEKVPPAKNPILVPTPSEIELIKALRTMPPTSMKSMLNVFMMIRLAYGKTVTDDRLVGWEAPREEPRPRR